MRSVKLTGYIFGSILAIAALALPAQAELVGYRIFLQEDGATLYTGELFIDDSQTADFYTFDQIKTAGGSLAIILEAATVTLEDVHDSANQGIITDDSGAPIAFSELVHSSNLATKFVSSHPAELFIHQVIPYAWMFVRSYSDSSQVSGDAVVFAPIQDLEPTANAGSDQVIHAGVRVTLNGAASFDHDTTTADLGYRWQLVQKPVPSTTVLMDADTATPSFIADVVGRYAAALVVTNKAGVTSAPDTVLIDGTNRAPKAVAGDDRLVVVKESVTLDGSGSADPEKDPVAYAWTIVSAPVGSTAGIADAGGATPSFTPDLAGAYKIQLEVSDFLGPGAPNTVEITAATAEHIAENAKAEAAKVAAEAEAMVTLKLQNQLRDGNFDALEQFLARAEERYLSGEASEGAVADGFSAFASAAPEFESRFKEWIAAKPGSHRPYLARGIYQQHIGWILRGDNLARDTTNQQFELMRDRFERAIQDLKAAVQRKPELGLTYSYLIGMLMVTGEDDVRDAVMKAGLAADPRSYSIRSRYLYSLTPWWGGSRPVVGEKILPLRIIELLRGRRYPVYVPEKMLDFMGGVESAATETPSLKPLLGYIEFTVAQILYRSGRSLEADRYFKRANEIADGTYYLVDAGDNYHRTGRYQDALALFTRVLESNPEDRHALQSRARTYMATRNYAASLADIDRALALDPKNPDLISDKAYTLSYAGRRDEALEMFDDALVYGEFNPDVYFYRGTLHLRNTGGKNTKAQDDFRRAVELNPANPRYWFDYGKALSWSGDCKANDAYQTYLELCSKYGSRCADEKLASAREFMANSHIAVTTC